MTLNWLTASRDDKNALIHVRVAGKTINGPDEGGILIPQAALMPDYVHDANRVIAALERAHWKDVLYPTYVENGCANWHVRVSLSNVAGKDDIGEHIAPNLCDAGWVALLRAHGVEVTT